MEASSHQLETRVFGRDQSVRGLLRVALAQPPATDIAIRVVYDRKTLLLNLHGLKDRICLEASICPAIDWPRGVRARLIPCVRHGGEPGRETAVHT
ncbi:hypothetical protein GCM10007881_49100 [Mesorhizobium huakuii]|nr:hypothetical protein GCM10007881_49100 [Mesorhizobium huakuii]